MDPLRPPWEDLDAQCRADVPRPVVERRWSDDDHETAVVPVAVDPSFEVPVAWTAYGSLEPEIAPFEWHPPHVETIESRATSGMSVERPSEDELVVQLAPYAYLTGRVAEATLRREPDGTLTAALVGYAYTDYGPPFRFYWEELTGRVVSSVSDWRTGDPLQIHLELAGVFTRVCGHVRLRVPSVGGSDILRL